LHCRGKAALGSSVFLLLLAVAVAVTVFSSPPLPIQPSEGSIDPASGIHITSSGAITTPLSDLPVKNIQRQGNMYIVTGDTVSMLTIERSNIVLEGNGFAFTGSHGIKLTKVTNVTIKDLTLETHYLRLLLDHAQNCVIQNVTSNFDFTLSNSNNNLVSNCSGTFRLETSNYNTIKNCSVGEITLQQSNYNSLLYNVIWTQGESLGIWDSSHNLVFGNAFSKFWWWMVMTGSSTNNRIVANNVWAGQIYLADKLVGINQIYHNNFWNFKWGRSASYNSANVWSSGGRGNYWVDYSGADANHDGVGDTPYIIDTTNQDNYPLVSPVDISSEPIPSL
jgi:nitrous oxidase accessory protein